MYFLIDSIFEKSIVSGQKLLQFSENVLHMLIAIGWECVMLIAIGPKCVLLINIGWKGIMLITIGWKYVRLLAIGWKYGRKIAIGGKCVVVLLLPWEGWGVNWGALTEQPSVYTGRARWDCRVIPFHHRVVTGQAGEGWSGHSSPPLSCHGIGGNEDVVTLAHHRVVKGQAGRVKWAI